MKTNFRFMFFLFLIIGNITFSQINIINNNSIASDSLIIKEFLVVYSDFIINNKCSKSVILTDYKKEDSISLFVLKESKFLPNFHLKKPDLCLYDSFNIIYIYTENWYKEKDAKWLNKILYKTIKMLDLHPKNSTWSLDSIFHFDTIHFVNYYKYSPPVSYKVYKNKIISKNKIKKMYYPQLSLKEVLHTYNLEPDKLNRVRCPNSKDSLPYIQIYTDSDNWYCKRENCDSKRGGVIEFIMKYENITRKEAIEKVKEFCLKKLQEN